MTPDQERRDAGPNDEESRPALDRDSRAHRRRRGLLDHASFGYTAWRCSVNPKRSGIASRWSAITKLTVGQDYWLCCQLSCRITAIKPTGPLRFGLALVGTAREKILPEIVSPEVYQRGDLLETGKVSGKALMNIGGK